MQSNFYSMLFRMKNIFRWGLMRNTRRESLSEHCLEVSCIAHCLAVIRNKRFGGNVDAGRVVTAALYHDASEILTGDLPTPVKYYDDDIKTAYKKIESAAANKLINLLPEDLREEYTGLLLPRDEEIRALVKAADKLAAYIKCIEETANGNREFCDAQRSIEAVLTENPLPEVKVFMEEFIPGFYKTLDEQSPKI